MANFSTNFEQLFEKCRATCEQPYFFTKDQRNQNSYDLQLYLEVHRSNLFMYADDHQVYFDGTRIESVASSLKNETKTVSQWYNLLQANSSKYQILVMAPQRGDKHAKDTCTLTIDDQQIRPTRNLL